MKVIAVLVAAFVAFAGCGADTGPGAAQVNADDVMFLQMMIPHHKQGVELARLTRQRAGNEELRTLAAAIESTQSGEVATMGRWLQEWQQPLVAPSDAHGGHDVPETDKAQIAALRGSARFDRDALNLLIAHQDDAVQLAYKEGFAGANPEVKAWAKQVEQSRKEQVRIMLDLLKKVP